MPASARETRSRPYFFKYSKLPSPSACDSVLRPLRSCATSARTLATVRPCSFRILPALPDPSCASACKRWCTPT